MVTTDTMGEDAGKQVFTSHLAGRPKNTRAPVSSNPLNYIISRLSF